MCFLLRQCLGGSHTVWAVQALNRAGDILALEGFDC